MKKGAYIENIKILGSKIILRGYAISGLEGKDENISKKLVVKNFSNDVYIKSLKNVLRTDINFLYKTNNYDFSICGFEDIEINLDEFKEVKGKYSFYIRIESDQKTIDLPLEIKLAEEKNKLNTVYFNIRKFIKKIEWGFEENKYLYIICNEIRKKEKLKDKIHKIKKNLFRIKVLIKQGDYKTLFCLLVVFLLGRYLRGKEIWLIGERRNTSQDNSYHLFKYIMDNNINENVYYVIDKYSSDYEKIKHYNNIINWGGIKHTIYLIVAKYSINSYYEKSNMYTDEYKKIIKWYPNISKRKKVFLQHGVIGMSRINHVLHKNRADLDIFIVSSEFEKKHILEEFGYKDEEVKVTGLARWDNLFDNEEKNIILVMPTWRKWINSKEEFLESEYFSKYISLFKNKKFIELLYRYDYEVRFFPHYHIQKLICDSNIDFDRRVKFFEKEKYMVQDLLKESKILITDYSSVSFDFAFMKKPVLFYQFDKARFYSYHYNNGPIKSDELFGKCLENEIDLISELEKIIGCKEMHNIFCESGLKFIDKIDNKNSSRIINILK